jgi:hypothetical protein
MAFFLLFVCIGNGDAITWSFDEDGDAQGWTAWDTYATPIPLFSEVHEGVWRITPLKFVEKQNRSVYFRSPIVNQSSNLFDRVTIRFRVVHPRPFLGSFYCGWRNSTAPPFSGNSPLVLFGIGDARWGFYLEESTTFTTDWQEVTISNVVNGRVVTYDKEHVFPLIWEGTLKHISFIFSPHEPVDRNHEPVAEQQIEALEIDKIILTGVEEQLTGELPPPSPDDYLGEPGKLLSGASLALLGKAGVEGWFVKNSPLVDVDGDKSLDLVLPWRQFQVGSGTFSLTNDGQGHFRQGGGMDIDAGVPPDVSSVELSGTGDLNGDGRGDAVLLLVGKGLKLELILSDPEAEGQYEIKLLGNGLADDVFAGLNLADFDEDGDLDLWFSTYPWEGEPKLVVLLNEGNGEFRQRVEFVAPQYYTPRFVYDVDRDGHIDVVWIPTDPAPEGARAGGSSGEQGKKISAVMVSPRIGKLGLEQSYALQIEDPIDFNGWLVQSVNDIDADGDADIVMPVSGVSFYPQLPARGLQVAVNDGTNHLKLHLLYDEDSVNYNTTHGANVADLSGDGILDLITVNSTLQSRGVLVSLGQENGMPQIEGYYPLEGKGDQAWPGDLDNDGDLDLVVPEIGYQGGGVYVLENQLSEQRTAVEEGAVPFPGVFHLSPAYPNPFNPGTVIPFTLGPGAEPVVLTVYNTLGQEIRRMSLGTLSAGPHQITWDGLDQQEKELSSGVYLYRLQAGAWSAAGKVVKSE